MFRRILAANLAFMLLLACAPVRAAADAGGEAAHLTVYEAGVAEFLEERTIELQPGLNTIEWRSLMPKADVSTVRVTGDGIEVVRQDVTYDGAQVRDERSPVLRLVLRNKGASGARRIRVDYVAPGLDWRSDYYLVLDATPDGAPAAGASLDSWVSLFNNTGADVRAGAVDLVAGEVRLLADNSNGRRDYAYTQNVISRGASDEAAPADASVLGADQLSAFSRFRLGRDIAMNANAIVNRFALVQGARLAVTQRHVFENDHGDQTLAGGGFALIPRGLDVRFVARNTTGAPLPAGRVTIYARTGEADPPQIIGQDRIPLMSIGGEFGVSPGRSSVLFGTRRVVERRAVQVPEADGGTDAKLITRIEVVLTNRGAQPLDAFVREGIERYGENEWKIAESSDRSERLDANKVQFAVTVPARGKRTVTYTVESIDD